MKDGAQDRGQGAKDRRRGKWSPLRIVLASLGAALLVLVVAGAWFVSSLFAEPDMTSLLEHHPFKSEKARARYLSHYDARAAAWPVPSESMTLRTSYGDTFLRVSGPEDAPPLVLLPSTSAPSLIWMSNVDALSAHFRVYALDNIYDFGRSVNHRPIRSAEDLVAWLDELFDALDLGNEVKLMGLSFGGWLSSQYALAHPERIDRTVWAAPVATVLPIPGEWAWRGILSALPHPFFMRTFMVAWLFEDLAGKRDAASVELLDALVDDAVLGLRCFEFRMPVTPTVLSDEELGSLDVPVLFLVGENEKLYAAGEALARLDSVAPRIETALIEGAGHDLTIVQADSVNARVIEFLLGRDEIGDGREGH